MKITTRHHCKTCEQQRPFEKCGPSHVLHLILALVTAGLWLPVWALVCVASSLRPYRCTTCGEPRTFMTSIAPSRDWSPARCHQIAIRLYVGLAIAAIWLAVAFIQGLDTTHYLP